MFMYLNIVACFHQIRSGVILKITPLSTRQRWFEYNVNYRVFYLH